MRKSHKRTLAAIFAQPTRADVSYDAVKSLLVSLGAEFSEGRGSRVKFYFKNSGLYIQIHRPHPRKEMPKWAIEQIRQTLDEAGMRP